MLRLLGDRRGGGGWVGGSSRAEFIATPLMRHPGFEWSYENTCWLRWLGMNEAHITLGEPAPSGQWSGNPLASYGWIHSVDDLIAECLLGDMPCR